MSLVFITIILYNNLGKLFSGGFLKECYIINKKKGRI